MLWWTKKGKGVLSAVSSEDSEILEELTKSKIIRLLLTKQATIFGVDLNFLLTAQSGTQKPLNNKYDIFA